MWGQRWDGDSSVLTTVPGCLSLHCSQRKTSSSCPAWSLPGLVGVEVRATVCFVLCPLPCWVDSAGARTQGPLVIPSPLGSSWDRRSSGG